MSKLLITLICLLFSTLSSASTVTITAQYREAANIFVIMDCVSGWWDKTFCQDDGAYQKEWSDRFGSSEQDQDLFSKYDSLRRRYYKGLGLPKDNVGPYSDGVFAKKASITEDRIAPIFYSSQTLED